jgi:type IV pilus assembly protein PilQ
VTEVQLSPTNGGINVVLETSSGDRPQILTSRRGKALVADIVNSQLRLTQGNSFRQNNPAPGIASVVITQLDPNSIRMVVTGTTSTPKSQPAQRNNKGISISISPGSGTALSQATPAPPASRNTPVLKPASPQGVATPAPAQTPAQTRDVLVPNPKITIDGAPAPATTTAPQPFLPRAIAPPVGDIAVSNTDSSPSTIDLDTTERVPRLVLRDAPVREVLSLLARAAGLNLAFTTATPPGTQPGQTDPAAAAADEGPKISLDIEDESVQDVFNYVLRISGLQANRSERTIFVGTRLSNEARNLIVRSFRLNQISVGSALNFLVAMGAESAVSRERTVTSVNAVPVGGAATPVTQTQTSTETRVETQRIDFQDSIPILRGLNVVGDERTNSVTLIGSPRQIDVATAQLIQLDSRRRQVAVNVKIVDINLLATDQFNTSFSFGIGDNFFQNAGGNAIINFGRNTSPPQTGIAGNALRGFTTRFLAQLQASITNGNAKILTDPTLTVQEGQSAVVNLTQEVFGGFELRTETTGTTTASTARTPIIKQAGLILQIRIERIDDNGFVSLSVAPTVSAIGGVQPTSDGDISLISSRQLTSGQIRLRDSQTLILSGIIQDSDRVSVTKVPILGDIPILGALFRNTTKTNQRQEVIVMLTPRIIDDAASASVGYNYTPGPEARQMLERRNFQVPATNRRE